MISQITEITDATDAQRCPTTILTRALAIVITAGCLAASLFFTEPGWLVMWLIAAALFFTCKALTLSRLRGRRDTASLLAYLLLWPGLNPIRFLAPRHRPDTTIARGGIVTLLGGGVLLWVVARQFTEHPLIAAWLGMIGLILVLHSGVFRLIAAFWMRRGRDVEPLMRCPVAADSLTNFWSKRWNLAFRDVSHALVFRPVSARWGASAATWAVFGLSGLLHELVISIPADAGYGGPTIYFLLQSAGIHVSRRFKQINDRLWAWIILIAPLGLLFHPPFIHRVMIPFFKTIGALP